MLAQDRRNEGVSGMPFSRAARLAAMAVLITSAASAQQAPMSEDLVWKLLEIGRVVDPPKTAALFAPMQETEPYQGVKAEREVKYGPADRHLLDVFTPETATSARPVLIFIHGGAFVGGNKRTTPTSPFYDNVMLWAVHNGFVGVNATYRLAPQSPYPAGAEDLAAVVAWVAGKIGERGGDPARIYLMGHSAGAVHVANYVSHPEFHKVRDGGLAGAVMVSGIYDLAASPLGDPEIAYFGSDPSHYAERSSLQGLLTTKIPLMIAAAELDPPRFVEQFNLLKQASCKGPNGCAHATMVPQHGHMSEVYAINAVETPLGDEILDFVKTGK
jgi:acetyl esterase/lipase